MWYEVKRIKTLWLWITCAAMTFISLALLACPIHWGFALGTFGGWWTFGMLVSAMAISENSWWSFDKIYIDLRKQVPKELQIWYHIQTDYRQGKDEYGSAYTYAVSFWHTENGGFLVRNPKNGKKVILVPDEFSGRFENISDFLLNEEIW